MSVRVRPVSTLSFLDLLCCGLGGVMMLFMIVVAVKGRVEFGPTRRPSTPGVQQQSPFAVVIVAVGPAPLFVPELAASRSPFDARGDASTSRADRRSSWGERYALYLAERPPSALKIGPFAPGAEADVQVFSRGRRRLSGRLSDLKPGLDSKGMLAIWPACEMPVNEEEAR